MPRLVLVHSPLVGPSYWWPLAHELESDGFEVRVPSLRTAALSGGPYASAFAAAVRRSVARRRPRPLVLIAHSGAGPFLPAIASALANVVGYVFIDASLPQENARWIDSVPAEVREQAIAQGEVPNPWRQPELWKQVGVSVPGLAKRLADEAITPPLALYEEPVSVPKGWPDRPVGYLAFTPNPFYAPVLQEAREANFVVRELPGQHMEMLIRPRVVATVLIDLLDELLQ